MKPIKVGVCLDFPLADVRQIFLDAVHLAFEEAAAARIIDREAELVVTEAEGLPRGDAHSVRLAWQDLADQGCLGIVGPLISDNSVAIAEHVEQSGRVPTLTWSGTDQQYGEYMFGFGNGSLPEEPYLMADFLAAQGHRSIGVVYENAVTGMEYFDYFRDAARREGLEIVQVEPVGQVDRDTVAVVARLRDRKPDALAYFGFGLPGIEMNTALAEIGWDPPRVMCAAFINCYVVPEWMRGLRGWVGVDQYDEENRVGQGVIDRFEKRFGYRQENCVPTLAYDCGTALAHGIGKAHPLTPSGVRRGLERVKMLPAATGGPGTRISLGRYVRRAWHGADYLVLREINDDATGTRLRARFRR